MTTNGGPSYDSQKAIDAGCFERAERYFRDRECNRDVSRADLTFAYRARLVSPSFTAAEALSRALGTLHECDINKPDLHRLIISMMAQVNVLRKDFENGL